MNTSANAIQVKKERGHMVVTSIGRTPRGTKYLKQSIRLSVSSPADPGFKDELARAVTELVAQAELPLG